MVRSMIKAVPLPTLPFRAVMLGMAMTLLAAVSLSAWSQPAPPPAGMDRPGGPGMRPEGMRGVHGGMHGDMAPGMMFRGSPERMGRMIDGMLDGINASDAQRSQIKQIVAAAAADLKTQMQSDRGLRERGVQIFTAPTVDAAAVEQLRQQTLQQHDVASKRVAQAMLDVARVLTPEQRARIGQRMQDRQARMQDRQLRMGAERPPR